MKSKTSILKMVHNEKYLYRIITFFLAITLVSFNYNAVLVKNNLVIGGMSGLAIVIKEVTGLSPSVFLYLSTAILTIVSLIFLDKATTLKALFGSLAFNIFVSLTLPIANLVNIDFNSQFILLIYISTLNGLCYGFIYRSGFNTGGSDVISAIISKYTKLPMGTSATWTNIFIITASLLVFGFTQTICSVFVLLVTNKIVDIIILGVKDSKMCYIKSKKHEEISKVLLDRINIGITEIASKGGVINQNEPVLIVIVPFDLYYGFKHLIKKIDKDAFILTIDCHDVSGGYKRELIPF